MKNIAVIDDEQYICNIIKEALDEFPDYTVYKFTEPEKAAEFIGDNNIDLVLTDLVMKDYSGVQILERTLASHPDAVVILMTGYPTVKTAISVLKKGGYDYLIKPFKLEDLKSTIRRGLELQQVKRENVELRSQMELMHVTDAINKGIKLQPLLNLVVDSAVKVLPAVSAAILLLDRKNGEYNLQAQSNMDTDDSFNSFLRGDISKCPVDFEKGQCGIYNEEFEINGALHRRSYVAFPLVSRGDPIGLLTLVYTDRFNHIAAGQIRLISLLASAAASAVESNYQDRNLQRAYLQTIKSLANAIEARDRYTAGHTDRVFRIARIIVRKMGWSSARLAQLKAGCVLHDIGKIGVPDSILNKPGQLTEYERNIMKKHPELGLKILAGVPFLEEVMPYIIAHHEKYDGTGYPYGLKGEDIPIEGRLLAVVDTFDAILSDRPYRPGRDTKEALDELIKYRGSQFDPVIVDYFMEAYNEGLINSNVIYGKTGLNVGMLNQI
ncbi:MAG: response regulator [candidate division Zixibacteria bacterium]|nr:response regulator [candidate division Zixibacteria bacterium]